MLQLLKLVSIVIIKIYNKINFYTLSRRQGVFFNLRYTKNIFTEVSNMSTTRFEEIVEEVTEDLELQAGIIITPKQLLSLQQTKQIRFKKDELEPYNIAGIKLYLKDTPTDSRVWDCFQSLSDDSLIVAIQAATQYVSIMIV